MRVLHIFPFFPGEPTEGSAVYERRLSTELAQRGLDIQILTTRTRRLQWDGAFDLRWPVELPVVDSVDGVRVRRFPSLCGPRTLRRLANRVVWRRWAREETREGICLPGSRNFFRWVVRRATQRPSSVDLLADLGRGPIVPGLLGYLLRTVARYDLILVGYAPFSLMRQVQAVVRPFRKPVVLLPFFHPEDPYHHFRTLYRSYERAAAILVLNPHTEALLKRFLPRSNPVTVGGGVDPERFECPELSGEAFKRRYGLEGKRILLFVGRKEPSKRYDLVVEALEALPSDVVLLMVGRDVDGTPLDGDRVRLLKELSREDLIGAYDACDVFVLPSEHESFGIVFLEAWLRRKPVIGSAHSGAVSALIVHGEDGLLCSGAREIAEAARALLIDPAKARKMGAAGYRKVVRDFTWKAVADRVMNVYERVVQFRSDGGTRGFPSADASEVSGSPMGLDDERRN